MTALTVQKTTNDGMLTTIAKPLDYLLYAVTGQSNFGEIIKWFYQATSSNTPVSKKLLGDIYNITLDDQKMYEASLSIVIVNFYEHLTGTHPEQLHELVARDGDIAALDKLISKGVYDNAFLFSSLINHGQENAALYLLNSTEIHQDKKYWDNILCVAAVNGYTQIAIVALQHGADINSKSYNKPPIELAVFNNQYPIVKLLKDNGADISDNILFFAVSDKHLQSGIVPYLVEECKVDLNYQEKNGSTVLMQSVFWSHTALAQYYIEHNADVSIGKLGRTPLHDAFVIGDMELALSMMHHGAKLKDHTVNLLSKALSISTKTDKETGNVISFMLCKGGYTAQEAQEVIDVDMSYEAKTMLSDFIDAPKDFCENYLVSEQVYTESIAA
jgi:hypothetical protein